MSNNWIGYARKAGLKKEFIGPFSSYQDADFWLKYHAKNEKFVDIGIHVLTPVDDWMFG